MACHLSWLQMTWGICNIVHILTAMELECRVLSLNVLQLASFKYLIVQGAYVEQWPLLVNSIFILHSDIAKCLENFIFELLISFKRK